MNSALPQVTVVSDHPLICDLMRSKDDDLRALAARVLKQIGGKTALAMGSKLAELARTGQVLCVTHLPQVAAYADTHYVVERDGDGPASVRRIDGEDRVAEIARMLAGLPESEAGRTAAAELLAGAGATR